MNARSLFSLVGFFAGTACFGQLSDTGQTTRYTQIFGENADFKGS
jgi:hypothetical protein